MLAVHGSLVAPIYKMTMVTIATPFDVVEAALSLIITSAQQAELYTLTRACTLANNKTASIYTNSRYTFGVSHDFEMWKQHSSLIPIKIKF